MKFPLALLMGLCVTGTALADERSLLETFDVSEEVYVESPTDTDSDGKPDRIYVSIQRPNSDRKLSTIFTISPYAMGGNDVPMHSVDSDLLPQDSAFRKSARAFGQGDDKPLIEGTEKAEAPSYAKISAHSVGTGKSTGCPTVGDISETLAAKAVIDWLNGRAKAFYQDGREAKADWANGSVGMTGTSYDGTLPIMVATTGVEGLKAIIPVAAISNWYDYYRANGLVVNPGGYIGEDADILGYFVVKKGACKTEMERLTQTMGRENGDFTPFWQKRDHLSQAKNIKAATFIIHGQSDWNVKQKHAIQLWEALDSGTPRRMFLHKGGHGSTWMHNVPGKVQAWFDHFLEGVENGITTGPQVEVELPNGSLMVQEQWPHESTKTQRLFLGAEDSLTAAATSTQQVVLTDSGNTQRIENLLNNPTQKNEGRLVYLTAPFEKGAVLSGTPQVSLNLAVMNRKAANITVTVIEYSKNGRGTVITRGWADPQNHADFARGERLVPGQSYQLKFDLEPKQYRLAEGSTIGVMVSSTDYEYTLRPKAGTVIQLTQGPQTYIDLKLSSER